MSVALFVTGPGFILSHSVWEGLSGGFCPTSCLAVLTGLVSPQGRLCFWFIDFVAVFLRNGFKRTELGKKMESTKLSEVRTEWSILSSRKTFSLGLVQVLQAVSNRTQSSLGNLDSLLAVPLLPVGRHNAVKPSFDVRQLPLFLACAVHGQGNWTSDFGASLVQLGSYQKCMQSREMSSSEIKSLNWLPHFFPFPL